MPTSSFYPSVPLFSSDASPLLGSIRFPIEALIALTPRFPLHIGSRWRYRWSLGNQSAMRTSTLFPSLRSLCPYPSLVERPSGLKLLPGWMNRTTSKHCEGVFFNCTETRRRSLTLCDYPLPSRSRSKLLFQYTMHYYTIGIAF